MERKKKALGRGLDSLIPTKNKPQFHAISLDKIIPNKYQPRRSAKKDTAFEELAKSIKEKGVIEPVIVSKDSATGKYMLIAGERRYRASLEAGLTEIPAVVREDIDEKDIIEIALIENIHREDLNPVEEAKAFKILIDEFNYTHEKLAQKLSISRSRVTNYLRLLNLPEEIKEMLASGLLTEGHARALLSLEDEEIMKETAKEIINRNLTVRETEELVKKIKKNLSIAGEGRKTHVKDPNIDNLAQKLSSSLKNKVEIRGTTGKGKIIIHYYNPEELNAISKYLMKFGREE